MKKNFIKHTLIVITSLIWLSVLTAFGSSMLNDKSKLTYKLSNNIYLNSNDLNKTLLAYKSSYDLSTAKFQSSCSTTTKFINKKWDLYLFELTVTDKNCSNPNFFLKSELWILNDTELNLVSDYKLYSILLDYSTKDLENVLTQANKNSSKFKIFADYKNDVLNDGYNFLKKKRMYEELIYKWTLVNNILEKRKEKYISPVPWYSLPIKNPSKFPNAWRPYRAWLTDWIHHSWDIDTPFWQKVVALDDGIIIRLVKNWDKTDLSKIRKWAKLTNDDKMRNLDIYRWNQVWLKTMKWEIIMYAHLGKVVDSLKEWTMVSKWDNFWTVWVTWVPEEWYDDYHLDFSVSENPYNLWKAWSYDIVDYMNWPWKFKWKSLQYIIDHQNDIFE